MYMRGSRPIWMACRVTEKAAVISACEAMMVAPVASTTSGSAAHLGARR